jgi:hypothetical protein
VSNTVGQKTRKGKDNDTVEPKETYNLEATKDLIEAPTEPPMESEEKNETPSFMSFDEEAFKEEPALEMNQPSAVGSYPDSQGDCGENVWLPMSFEFAQSCD